MYGPSVCGQRLPYRSSIALIRARSPGRSGPISLNEPRISQREVHASPDERNNHLGQNRYVFLLLLFFFSHPLEGTRTKRPRPLSRKADTDEPAHNLFFDADDECMNWNSFYRAAQLTTCNWIHGQNRSQIRAREPSFVFAR